MLNWVLILIGILLFFVSLKTTLGSYRKINNHPQASRYRKPVLIKDSKTVHLGTYIETCKMTKPTTCPKSTTCSHLSRDMKIYHDDIKEPFVTLTRNIDWNDGYCLRSTENFHCNQFTGDPFLINLKNSLRYVCQCKYPHLVNKTSLFGDCDEILACKPHGQLIPVGPINFDPLQSGKCECHTYLFKPAYDSKIGPFCGAKRKRTYDGTLKQCLNGFSTSNGDCICPSGFLKVSKNDPDIVDEKFREQLGNFEICVKNPCMWNALNPSEFLRSNRMNGNECNCNYTTSIPIETHQSILTGRKNACISPSPVNFGNAVEIRYDCCFYNAEDAIPTCHFHYFTNQKSQLYWYGVPYGEDIYLVKDEWKDNAYNLFKMLMRSVRDTGSGELYTNFPFEKYQPSDFSNFERDGIGGTIALKDSTFKDAGGFVKPVTDFKLYNCQDNFPLARGVAKYNASYRPLCIYQGQDMDLHDQVIIGPKFAEKTQFNCFWIRNIHQILLAHSIGEPPEKPVIQFYDSYISTRFYPPDL